MGFELGLGFVVATVTFGALPDSNSFSITLRLWLECQRVFLSVISLLVDCNLYYISVSEKGSCFQPVGYAAFACYLALGNAKCVSCLFCPRLEQVLCMWVSDVGLLRNSVPHLSNSWTLSSVLCQRECPAYLPLTGDLLQVQDCFLLIPQG